MSTNEEWRAVPGYEGAYEVSSLGAVRSLARLDSRGRSRRAKLLKPRLQANGRLTVALYLEARRSDFQVHALVLLTFIGPRPDGMEGCHRNDDPADNRLENLRWDTRSANCLDSVRNGTHHMARRTHCPKGHEYTVENTYTYPGRNRACNECRRIYREEHRQERREKGREYARRKRAEATAAGTAA